MGEGNNQAIDFTVLKQADNMKISYRIKKRKCSLQRQQWQGQGQSTLLSALDGEAISRRHVRDCGADLVSSVRE